MKKYLATVWLGVSLLLLGAIPATVHADHHMAMEKSKVVYHVNQLERARGALRNVKNHLNAVGDKNVEIIVVTHGKGAFVLVDGTTDDKGTYESDIAALSNRGVKFQMCENTINGFDIDRNMINLVVEIVPSGVAQVANLQHQGYVYIKP